MIRKFIHKFDCGQSVAAETRGSYRGWWWWYIEHVIRWNILCSWALLMAARFFLRFHLSIACLTYTMRNKVGQRLDFSLCTNKTEISRKINGIHNSSMEFSEGWNAALCACIAFSNKCQFNFMNYFSRFVCCKNISQLIPYSVDSNIRSIK